MKLSSNPFSWVVIGIILAIIARFNNYAFLESIERYLFTAMMAIITLSFTAFSLTMNSLIHLKEKKPEIKLRLYISEVEENIRYLIWGLVICFISILLKSTFPDGLCSKDVWLFTHSAIIFSVITMFVLLVKDIIEAYFILLKNIYKD